MQTDENYWVDLTEDKVREDGFYWFRGSVHTPPEIMAVGPILCSRCGGARYIRWFDKADSAWSVARTLQCFPGAQVSIERIVPPKD